MMLRILPNYVTCTYQELRPSGQTMTASTAMGAFNSVTNTRAIAKKAMRGETMRVRNIVNTLKHDGGNAQSEVAVVTLPGRVEEGGRRRVSGNFSMRTEGNAGTRINDRKVINNFNPSSSASHFHHFHLFFHFLLPSSHIKSLLHPNFASMRSLHSTT